MKRYAWLLMMFLAIAVLFAPVFVFADGEGDPTTGTSTGGIQNPIKFNDLNGFLLAIVDGVVQVGFYLVVIFIIYSGFLFVKARGNEAELKKAKEAFLYTVIGAAILLGATVLANVISGTIDQIRSGSGESGGDTRLLP